MCYRCIVAVRIVFVVELGYKYSDIHTVRTDGERPFSVSFHLKIAFSPYL